MTMNGPLCIIAGGRQFPFLVAKEAKALGIPTVAIGFFGHTDPELFKHVSAGIMLHIGQAKKIFQFLEEHKVENVVFAGTIHKPRALNVRPDFLAAKLFYKLRNKGDDSLLSAIAGEFTARGYMVHNPLKIAPSLATPAGPLTQKAPYKDEMEALCFAWPRAKVIGEHDIGQSVLVKRGVVLAVEGPEGTDAAIARAGELCWKKGMVLCKVLKPGQDTRFDLPVIGKTTVEAMAKAGGSCIGIEAHNSICFDQKETIALAQAKNIRIIGITQEMMTG